MFRTCFSPSYRWQLPALLGVLLVFMSFSPSGAFGQIPESQSLGATSVSDELFEFRYPLALTFDPEAVFPGCWYDNTDCRFSNCGTVHSGVDYRASFRDPIWAANFGEHFGAPGAGTQSVFAIDGQGDHGLGNAVGLRYLLRNGRYLWDLNGHLNDHKVLPSRPGMADRYQLPAGTIIGFAGETGGATGVHDHYEMKHGPVLENPWPGPGCPGQSACYGYVCEGYSSDLFGYLNPESVIANPDYKVLVPQLDRDGFDMGYDEVFGVAGVPLHARLQMEGVDGPIDYLCVAGRRLSDQSQVDFPCASNVGTINPGLHVEREFSADDYTFFAALQLADPEDHAWKSGFRRIFSILPSSEDFIVDNDISVSPDGKVLLQRSSGLAEERVDGYLYGAYITAGDSQNWARWFPHVSGRYEIWTFVGGGGQGSAPFKVYTSSALPFIVSDEVDFGGNPYRWRRITANAGQQTVFDLEESGYLGLVAEGSASDRYLFDAIKFIRNVIGVYENQSWNTSSQTFLDSYEALGGPEELGYPVDHNGGGEYVHWWSNDPSGSGEGVWIQDLQRTTAGASFPEGRTALILNGSQAFLLKEGFWIYYMNHQGYENLGAPTTTEYVQGGLTRQDFDKGYLTWDPNGSGDGISHHSSGGSLIRSHQVDFVSSMAGVTVWSSGRLVGEAPVSMDGCEGCTYVVQVTQPSSGLRTQTGLKSAGPVEHEFTVGTGPTTVNLDEVIGSGTPSGSFTAPIGTHTGNITISAQATDDDGLSRVRAIFTVSGTGPVLCGSGAPSACVGTGGTYSRTNVDPAAYGASEGNVGLRLLVQDDLGNEQEVSEHSFTWQAPEVPRVSGRVVDDSGQPVEGVRMDGLPWVVWTDSNGEYRVPVGEGWSGTVDPSKAGHDFVPAVHTFNNVSQSVTADFVSTVETNVIAGTVTFNGVGLSGVAMSGLPGDPETDPGGAYSAIVPFQWSGTVTPSLTGYEFTPTSRTYDRVGMSRLDENYTAVPETFIISGRITQGTNGVAGVLLNGLPGGIVTDTKGDYLATVPYGWSGTVTPFKGGLEFMPASKTYGGITTDRTSGNYDATPQPGPPGNLFVASSNAQLDSAARAASSGDVILVKPGTYSQLSLSSLDDGVTMVSETGAEQTILEFSSSFRVTGKNNVIDGFTIRNLSTSLEPMELLGFENVQIRNSIFHSNGTEYALRITSGTDVLVENSVFATGRGILLRTGSTMGALTVRNCRFSNLSNGALLGGNANLEVVLENNLFEASTNRGLEIDEGLGGLRIENNIFASNAIGLALDGNPGTLIKNCVFYNNTTGADLSSSSQATFENSIFAGNGRGIDIASNVVATIHHTMHWENTSMWYGSGNWNWDWNTIWEDDAAFVNQAGGDFHLTSGSPARGLGTNNADLGAYGGPRGSAWIDPPGASTPPVLEALGVTGPTDGLAGATLNLRADAQYSGGYEADVSNTVAWSSSDPTVLEWQSGRTFLALAPGAATITATYEGLSDTHTVTISSANLSIALTDSLDPVAPGDPVSLTVLVTNSGPAAAANTVVQTTLPAELAFVSAVPAPDSGTTDRWTLGDVPAGSSISIEVAVQVAADAATGTTLSSGASVVADLTPAAQTVESTAVVGEPDLVLSKQADVSSVDPGGAILYTLTYQNAGSASADGVVLTEIYSPDIDFVSANPAPDSSNNIWQLGTLAPGASGTITVSVTVNPQAASSILNQASIAGTQSEPTPGDNTAAVSTSVNPQADLALELLQVPAAVSEAEIFSYVWRVTNAGPAVATGVDIVHTVPAGLGSAAVTPSQGSCSVGSAVNCSMGTLAAGASAIMTVEARADTVGVQVLSATVGGIETDPETSNNQATDTVTVDPSADLRVTLHDSPDPLTVGQLLVYSVTVENLGPSNSTGGQVVDLLPASLAFVSSVDGCSEAAGTVTCSFGPLAAGASVVRNYTVDTTGASASNLSNSVTVTGNEGDPESGNNTAAATTTLQAPCYALTRDRSGSGAIPTASAGSGGCPAGSYGVGEQITVTALPAADWGVGSWSGSDSDASTSTVNTVTMPAADHTVVVHYVEETLPCLALRRVVSGSGDAPALQPPNSPSCPVGEFHPGTLIDLTAIPDPGWTVGTWSGTDDDSEVRWANTVTMPVQSHEVTVEYVPCRGQRALPAGYGEAQPVQVALAAEPPSSTVVYAVEETPPVGWQVGTISHSGAFDSQTGTVKWGPFFDNQVRTLSYDVTPPGGTGGSWEFAGVISVDGSGVLLCGDQWLEPASLHPADLSDSWGLEINEITSYGASWKTGDLWPRPPQQIPINYVTNAGFLWKGGEAYIFDPAANPPWVLAPGAAALATAPSKAGQGMGSAVSNLVPGEYTPGEGVQVTIAVVPDAATQVYAVEDGPPSGWTISAISDNGSLDAVNGLVKWGPFFDNLDRDLSYVATPPVGETGQQSFSGQASFDGAGVAITGGRTIDRSCTYGLSPTSAMFGPDASGGTVNVLAPMGCSWQIGSDQPWLTVNAGSPGNGNATVLYSVSANPGSSARNGTLSIVGLTTPVHTVTQESSVCYRLDVSHEGAGGPPARLPSQSGVCPVGQYLAGQVVSLTANPAFGWMVESWAGTDDDTSTATENTVTMPVADHLVRVRYVDRQATILLVDDDDNSPDVRTYYTNALAGVNPNWVFDVWDTQNSDNEPDAVTLANYNTVIWFTGGEFGGFAGPSTASEGALGSFLDGGGCLFLSSQSYLFDRGGEGADLPTPFMADYLGLAAGVSDVGQGTVTGTGSAFSGFGSEDLSPPFANFSAIVSPDATAELAFQGDMGDAAINKQNQEYRTVFFGFPFEGLPTSEACISALRMVFDFCWPMVIFRNDFENMDLAEWSGTVGEILP
jgi:uncharacterized repeat protein (TIGR01451 family)